MYNQIESWPAPETASAKFNLPFENQADVDLKLSTIGVKDQIEMVREQISNFNELPISAGVPIKEESVELPKRISYPANIQNIIPQEYRDLINHQ